MEDKIKYDFSLDNWTPGTLPMARLCQYLEKLSTLFGNKDAVHFDTMRKGSAILQISVDSVANESVQNRIEMLGNQDAATDIKKVKNDINSMLREDKTTGHLKVKRGATIFQFPGYKAPLINEIVVQEFGELEGEIIRVGGKDDSVPVWIQGFDGSINKCVTTKAIARELGPLIFAEPIKVSGNGKWRRTAERVWLLEEFSIKSWEVLDCEDLQTTIEKLREIQGSGWNRMENPQLALSELRGDE